MNDSNTENPEILVPRVEPAPKPLRFPSNLIQLLSNNLKIIPAAAYREDVVIAPGPPRMAFVTGAEALKTVLQGKDDEFPRGQLSLDIQAPLFGNAMIQSHGGDWRWQRRLMAPLFRHEELLSYTDIMSGVAEDLIALWRKKPTTGVRPVNQDMMQATLAVISRTMLGGSSDKVRAVMEAGHAEYYRQINWWILYCMLRLPHGLPRPGGSAMRTHEKRLREAVRTLVHARREADLKGEDLLGRLLQSKHPETGLVMTEEQLVDNIIAFLVAGSDTTALALTWALYLIARSPRWAHRMRAEVERVAGDAPIGREHLSELVVVKQVLNETLRLFPTAPVTVRDTLRDVELGGVPISAGTIIIVPFYAIHRHQSFWRDPDRFDPARFAADAPDKPGRYHFLPFGAGPRICIGAAFSMIEATIMLAALVRAADFELTSGYEPQVTGQMFLTPGGDMPMRIRLRG
ncbi:cytochrome P450 [Candidatus Thiodiazotropha endoloripes]|uniref:Cytochrome P450 n=1 Tax=Candidatus Thiodiazotropha endoloripes TaxID=1818881 RepID=A0A1E2UPV6_9GAMM|nr:cytochrome P450 [Candidatus Thiodiazotropha endoloripes]MCW4184023.1 cytochrome P450 [Candidatus Thiodiazotropha weberae]MCW4192087.1 cytochrome P450 [Candidatus Thiodiazotropha weberae]ODB85288.1 hypothetical protein A3195_16955 [Candidatus Thiodiazotropha endoloripes]ODB87712.1 hypothetical protein A3193_02065 [Candidatus Thiodiazotropha endoloripes]ODB96788.1 hypothetical protein A3196_08490 [Candidatus Thiodiazotropha endoloripes]